MYYLSYHKEANDDIAILRINSDTMYTFTYYKIRFGVKSKTIKPLEFR